jgi:hypothetical protein
MLVGRLQALHPNRLLENGAWQPDPAFSPPVNPRRSGRYACGCPIGCGLG